MSKIILFLILIIFLEAQLFEKEYYPIGRNPYLEVKTPIVEDSLILFEASPILRLNFHNNFIERFVNKKNNYGSAWYLLYQPTVRMYKTSSEPVRMPSYQLLFGTQHSFLCRESDSFIRQFSVGIESGHYSNGQEGCTFSKNQNDHSPACDSIYSNINTKKLDEHLNRKNGNFSTDLTSVTFSYKTHEIDINTGYSKDIDTYEINFTWYHNYFFGLIDLGGYDNTFDEELYGKFRINLLYEKMKKFDSGTVYEIEARLNYIVDSYENKVFEVIPFRFEFRNTWYLFDNDLGLYGQISTGHDNYNIRFLDHNYFQLSAGVTWNIAPPIQLVSGI